MRDYNDYVITDRGGIVENRHKVHAAIVDANGELLYAVGDPSRVTLARSAAKPAQALAILETGAFEHFGLDDADLALMCASHSSEYRHGALTLAMLAKIQAEEGDLYCGGHPALSKDVNHAWIKRGYTPTAVWNNCSGKHVGMLAGAKAIGAVLVDYNLPTHPMQQRVRRVVDELCGLDTEGSKWGVDGCNLPTPAFPLQYLGRLYAVLAAAADSTESGVDLSTRTRSLSRIFLSMAKHPELVGGDGRFCTILMQLFCGSLIGKLGADGCYGIGIRASETTKRLGADGAIGISVKIEDGNIDILYSAIVEIFKQLQLGTPDLLQKLANFHCPKTFNTAGIVTGQVSHPFRVRAIK
jgi:L-asparaginase II